ncbi:RING-H2 zinc finger protein RHA1a [Apostasia shenzhenica]|uniref:RING-H2 zinc finger protein RHA1a n=1 Tax=Apostasia shenzhenica TaxID=1088818 RepID=A0A2H9ZRI4_9ASPA|nr:RING-H2 zinc finger protein RHA1a [Apostasia shenzhenica]
MPPKPLMILLHLLDLIFFAFSAILYRMGLNPSFATAATPWDTEEILFSADPSPAVTAAVTAAKTRLPVVEYQAFARNRLHGGLPPPACAVCLQLLEARDEVRELGNCCHVFHAACIDRWVDLGRFSCPLCRSDLLPPTAGALSFLKLAVAGDASFLMPF